MELTEREKSFIARIETDMKYYQEYKKFMAEVKGIFIKKGPNAAKQFIREKADYTLGLATDELFWSLFTNL